MSIRLSLHNIRSLLTYLPVQYTRPTVHVAGTNGKGSVCAFVSSMIAAADPALVVGRFNSPHLLTPNDGICIQNKPISPDVFWPTVREVERIDKENDVGASSFELYTCFALVIFERAKVDVVVLEVGMGGRLDATNVLPDACILASALTAVDLDHQALLGDTVELITREKAAIARRGRPFVLGPQVHRQVEDVARLVVEEAGGEILPTATVTPAEWSEELDGPLPPTDPAAGISVPLLQPVHISMPCFSEPVRALLPLHGEHQLGNLSTAAGVISALLTHPSCQLPGLNLRERLTPTSISRGVQATRWPGRLSYHTVSLPADPSAGAEACRVLVLADGAHNPASATALAAYLSSLQRKTAPQPLTLTYILALSDSPPKTPAQTLRPLFAVKEGRDEQGRLGAALLAFTPPYRMPWVQSVSPANIRAAVEALVPATAAAQSVEIWEDQAPSASQAASAQQPAERWRPADYPSPQTDHIERVLRWAARRRRDGEDALVVLAGSLYLVADFYRLLEKLGQDQDIWGVNRD